MRLAERLINPLLQRKGYLCPRSPQTLAALLPNPHVISPSSRAQLNRRPTHPIPSTHAGVLHLLRTTILTLALGVPAKGQPIAPPYQDYVAALGQERVLAWNVAGLNPGRTFTLETWVYLSRSSDSGWIAGKGNLDSVFPQFFGYALVLSSGSRPSFVYTSNSSRTPIFVTAAAAIPPRKWTHLAAVMDGTETRLFVDGEIVATGRSNTAPNEWPELPFSVGSAVMPVGSEDYLRFPGYARQLRFWSVARTGAQIRAALGESRPPDAIGLVVIWPLDDPPGSLSAREISGAGHALSLGGFVPTQTALLAAGPFFADGPLTATSTADGAATRVVAIDFDSDGDLDLVFLGSDFVGGSARFGQTLRAYRNERGAFLDATAAVFGGARLQFATQALAGDFDRDGRTDLLILGRGASAPPFPGEQIRLFLQTHDGRLADASARLPQRLSAVLHGAVADVDGDGDLDVVIGADLAANLPPSVYLNDGAANFTPTTDRIPARLLERSSTDTVCALVDISGDGRPDLIIGGARGPDELLINNGQGHFFSSDRWVLPKSPRLASTSTTGIGASDFDGDGRNDLVFSGWGPSKPRLQLILNPASGPMLEVDTGVVWASGEYAAERLSVVDFNRDGRPDILARSDAAGRYAFRLLLNQGPESSVLFSDVSATLPAYRMADYVAADFDRNGINDLLVAEFSSFSVAYSKLPMVFPRLGNLSVRSRVGTGETTLIAGFTLAGAGTGSFLVRAVGPTLGAFGLTDVLADPLVEVASVGGTTLAANDDWGGALPLKTATAAAGAFPLSADASKDAALIFAPGAGAYLARVSGTDGRTGIALAELYNVGTGRSPRLLNLSARTQVGAGADALIAGFGIEGTLPKRLLIRATGPALAGFGVGGTLADPVIAIRPLGSSEVIAANNDWGGTAALKATFTVVGAFPFPNEASRDAAIVLELPPGSYTATVSGNGAATGIALVEIYELP